MVVCLASILVLAWSVAFSQGSVCPTWFYHPHHSDTECECGSEFNGIIRCDNGTREVSILNNFCMTPFSDSNDTLVVGKCFVSERNVFLPKFKNYLALPSNGSDVEKAMCQHLHRRGRLCGKCRDNFYMPVYSYNGFKCMPCTSSFLVAVMKYIGFAYVPLTIFFLLIFVFRINAFSPKLNCVVTICQILTSPVFLRGFAHNSSHVKSFSSYYVRILGTVYGIWNLDFFRIYVPPICFPLSSLQVLALDYIVAIYPLSLLFLFYTMIALYERNVTLAVFLLKPFVRLSHCFKRQWDIRSSVIDSFASFVLLSFMKTASTSLYFLFITEIRDVHGGWMGYYLFTDPSLKYFSRTHLPYAITGIVIFLIWGLFTVILLLYPMMLFQSLLNKLRLNSPTLRVFMQCFQGHYRDRTDGGFECRYFSALYPLLRFSCLFILGSNHGSLASPALLIVLLIVIVLISSCTPYRHPFQHYNKIDVFLIASLGVLCASEILFLLDFNVSLPHKKSVYAVYVLTALVAHVPLVYFLAIIFSLIKKWLFKLRSHGFQELSQIHHL